MHDNRSGRGKVRKRFQNPNKSWQFGYLLSDGGHVVQPDHGWVSVQGHEELFLREERGRADGEPGYRQLRRRGGRY